MIRELRWLRRQPPSVLLAYLAACEREREELRTTALKWSEKALARLATLTDPATREAVARAIRQTLEPEGLDPEQAADAALAAIQARMEAP